MQRNAWTITDKSGWPPGPWRTEPDRLQWADEFTGYPCLILRKFGHGHLCGHVAVPPGHPFHGRDTEDMPMTAVHWGEITYAAGPSDGTVVPPDQVGYTMTPGDDPPFWIGDAWWFGFNACHAGDLCPNDPVSVEIGGDYRSMGYMALNCSMLAVQLAAYTPGGALAGYADTGVVSFPCPVCGWTSHGNPPDAREGYCGHCHATTRVPRVAATSLFTMTRESQCP